ncbi:MAG: hypothetical protein GY827_07755 [Cytophagales bacterium]|nr:hypothetical protein [Cytophagales bacterium]
MNGTITSLKQQLKEYKLKYYKNLLIKGSILFLSTFLIALLAFSGLEFVGNFDKLTRAIFFFSFLAIALFSLIKWIILPIKQLINIDNELSDEEASRQVGAYFPEIKDKLLNTLQLAQNSKNNALVLASIAQKTTEISHISFEKAVDYRINKKYLKYIIPPAALALLLLLFSPNFFAEGSKRIIQYQQTFEPKAPFTFALQNQTLEAFKNEDFTISLQVEGTEVPNEVFVMINQLKRKMKKNQEGLYTYTLEKIKNEVDFNFVAVGYESINHHINIISRPNIQNINASLVYPSYLGKKEEKIENIGSFNIPEGTQVKWSIKTKETERLQVIFNTDSLSATPLQDNQFTFTKTFKNSTKYELELMNQHSKNLETISYNVQVIKDRYPTVRVEAYEDTVLFSYILLGGALIDDYGLSKCQLFYRKKKKGEVNSKAQYIRKNIQFVANQTSQKLFYQLDLLNVDLQEGETIEYFVKVWDNDGINGAKSTSSQKMEFAIPDQKEIDNQVAQNDEQNTLNMQEAINKAQQLKKNIKETKNKLKSKKKLTWQDKKELQQLLQDQKQLEQEIEKMQEEFRRSQEQLERFEQQSESIQEKAEQIQELMEEVLDEETKELMEKLQELLKDQQNNEPEDVNELLEQMEFDEDNVENELERTLELYKKLKFEQDLEQQINDMKELAQKQEELAQKSLDKNTDKDQLAKEQEQLNKEMERAEQQLEQLEKDNKELKSPNDLNAEELKEMMKQAQKEGENGQQQLQQGNKKKANKSQEKAGQQMKKMAQQMMAMQQGMQMQQQQENMENLKAILENLVTVSFEQEDIFKKFKNIRQSNPQFVSLSQKQLKLKDDAVVIEDSLLALAGRVFQIKSFVTKELGDMKEHMHKSSEFVKMRKPRQATKHQQYSMTSMNNLALLLSDILQQMQEQMAQQMQGNQMCQKPGGNQPQNLGKQQQQLNQMIQQLKNGQKSGRQLSEQLAKLAAQQEAIRRKLQEMKKGQKMNSKLSKEIEAIEKQMEETELDLVRKNLSNRTIKRQEQIKTRLLEVEKAAKEQGEDNKRKSKTGKKRINETPAPYEEYLRKKQQQIELLKTVTPSLNHYYKKEVNEYFNNLGN